MTVDLNLATLEQITDELMKRYPHGVVVVGLTLLGSIEEMNQNRGKDGSGN